METTILYGIIIILAGMLVLFEVKIGLFQLLIEGWWYDFKKKLRHVFIGIRVDVQWWWWGSIVESCYYYFGEIKQLIKK
jgi:hypothetical protein